MSMDERTQLIELRRRVFQIERLPAMPFIVSRLMETLGDERTTPTDLERIIESDAALSSKLLSLANSAYYGFSNKITTIRRAVVVIGFRELQLLAMGAGLAGIFDMRKAPRGFDGEGLWIHCMVVSWISGELAKASPQYPASGEIMISGLLHDLGKLVLATHLSEYYVEVLQTVNEETPYYEAEKQLGLQHTTIGNWLAKRWSLPEVHIAAIRDHHSPRASDPYFISTSLVFLADRLAKTLGLGLVQEAQPTEVSPAMNVAKLTPDLIRSVVFKAKEQMPPMLHMWRQMTKKV